VHLKKRDWQSIRKTLNGPVCELLYHPCNFVALCRVRGSYKAGILQEFVQRLRRECGDAKVTFTVNEAIDRMGNTPLSAAIHSLADTGDHREVETNQPIKKTPEENLEGLAKLKWLLQLGASPAKMLNPVYKTHLVKAPPVFEWLTEWMSKMAAMDVIRMLMSKDGNATGLFDELLYTACGIGPHTLVLMVIEASKHDVVNQTFYAGCTPLMRALDTQRFGVAQLLLNHGAKPTAQNEHGQTAGYFAIKHGAPFDLLLQMVDCGMDLYAKFPAGTRLMHAACYFSDLNSMLLLLLCGDSVQDDSGCNIKPIELLNKIHHPILHDPKALVAHLRKYKESETINNRFCRLHLAIVLGFDGLVENYLSEETSLDAMIALDIDRPTFGGGTLLSVALKLKRFKIASKLLNNGCSPNANISGQSVSTLVEIAIKKGAPAETFQDMLRNGLDLSENGGMGGESGVRGGNLLHLACIHGRVDVAALLVKAGKRMDDTQEFLSPTSQFPGRTLFSDADALLAYVQTSSVPMNKGAWYQPLFQELVRVGQFEDATVFYIACSLGMIPLTQQSLDGNIKCIDAKFSRGRTALCSALEQGHFEIASLLLQRGANPNVGFPNAGYYAIKSDVPQNIFRELLDSGLDTKSKLPSEQCRENGLRSKARLLHLACKLNRYSFVMQLISAGDAIKRRGNCTQAPQEHLIDSVKRALYHASSKVPHMHHQFESDTCAVCLEDFEHHVTVLKCGHVFDVECAASLLEHEAKHCPLCRKGLEVKSVLTKEVFHSIGNLKTTRRNSLPFANTFRKRSGGYR